MDGHAQAVGSIPRLAAACAMAALCSLLAACGQGPPADRLIEGRPFPYLSLHEFDGSATRSIEDYRGRIVVLNVWATWCPPCRRELPSLERLHGRLDPGHFAVIAMSVDSDADIAMEFLLDRGVSFKSYFDRDGDAADRVLGIRIYPDTFIISADGTLLRKFVGEREWDDPRLIAALEAARDGDPGGLRAIRP